MCKDRKIRQNKKALDFSKAFCGLPTKFWSNYMFDASTEAVVFDSKLDLGFFIFSFVC